MKIIDLFKLLGTISIDTSDATKQLDNVSNKGKQTESKLSKTFSAVGKGALKVGKVIGTGIMVGAGALGTLTAKAVSMAGELEQNMGGSEAVFGKYAGKMQETAKKAFSNMGLSTSDYLATANKMGALFQGAGFDVEESMQISQDAMQRAADVASIMGIDTSAAMEAVAGAAKGNFTMMDNLGVAMNDTAIEAYALEKGIEKSTAQMTQQEKIGLAMEMFLDKTAYAAGNYAKENETLAGSLGTAKAALSNFLSGSGSVDDVVSSFTNAGEVIVKNIVELFPKLTTGLTQIVSSLVPMIPQLLNSLLPGLIDGATSLINGLVAAMPQIVSALLDALPALIEGITQIVNAITESLPSLIQTIVDALPTLIPMIIDALVSMIVTICEQLPNIIMPIIDALPEIVISIVDALMDNLPALIEGCVQLVIGLVQAIPQIIQALIEAIPTIITRILQGVIEAFPILLKGVIELVANLLVAIIKTIQSSFGALKNVFSNIWEIIKNIFSGVGKWFGEKFKFAKDQIQQAWSTVKEFFANIWSGIKNVFGNVREWFGEKFTAAKERIQNAWSSVKDFFRNIKDGIANAFADVKEKLSRPFIKARDAIKNVVDKIKGFFSNLKFKWPKLKLPKFSISPEGWKVGDLLKGVKPKLGITWAKEGGIFDEPTLFNTPTGMLGVGEAGAEAVAPIDKLMGYVHEAVQSETNGLAERIDNLLDMLAAFFPQILTAANKPLVVDKAALASGLAPQMNIKLGEIQSANARGR